MSTHKDLSLKINIKMSEFPSLKTICIKNLETNYAEILKVITNEDLKKLLDYLDDSYYNGESLVSDPVYDSINDVYYHRVGGDKSSKTGHKVDTISKVKLPFVCTSLDKVKPGQSKLSSFFKKYTANKFVSSKLDGNSLLVGRQDGQAKAWTRGDGTYGQDVSHILEYITGPTGETLSQIIKKYMSDGYYVRGEIIISKENWEDNSHLGSNARNVIAGLIHNKTLTPSHIETLSTIVDFLGYEVIRKNGKLISRYGTIENQFNFIKEMGFSVPLNFIYTYLKESELPDILEAFKNESKYEIDGVVIENNEVYDRYTSGNPKYAKAFKMDKYNDSAIVTVKNIDWTITKSFAFKPTIVIEPTIINQVQISRVYAYNARYLVDNQIGKGSLIEVIRSGDVIPKVKNVIESKFKLETDFPSEDYEWDNGCVKTGINIQFSGEFNDDAKKRQIEHFIKTTGIEFIKQGTIKKLYEIGFVTIKDYITLKSATEFTKADGIKIKSATKMYESVISSLTNTEEYIFAAAVPSFNGMGTKRMKIIMENIPNFLALENEAIFNNIIKLEGFSDKMAQLFIDGIENYKSYRDCYTLTYGNFASKEPVQADSNSLEGFVFCFSKVRSKETENKITSNGGSISSSVSKKTTHLIVKDKTESSGKITKAQSMGITVLNLDEFDTLL